MFKFNAKKLNTYAKNALAYCDKNASQILFVFGIGLGVSAMVSFAKAGGEAEREISAEIEKQKKELQNDCDTERNDENDTPVVVLSKKDIIRVTWKAYVVPTTIGALSVLCLIKSRSIDAKQTALLAAMLKASEESYKDYKKAVEETVPEKKTAEIHDKYVDNRMERYPSSSGNVYCTGNGDQLCFDELSGLYFKSSTEHVKLALAEATAILRKDDTLALSEVYDLLGLPSGDYARNCGWNTEYTYRLDYRLRSKLTDTDIPCLVIEYMNRPTDRYNDRY